VTRFLVDTSALARAGRPDVREQLRALLAEDGELVLSAPVVIELLRVPVGAAVGARRAELLATYAVLVPDTETFTLAYAAMERLAAHAPTAHRLPLSDLVTAALAAQHRCAVVHVDRDFALLAEHGGLDFEALRLRLEAPPSVGDELVHAQRTLRRELHEALHLLPMRAAVAELERAVVAARAARSRA
jgi:predicted nucleic acid-binding protein